MQKTKPDYSKYKVTHLMADGTFCDDISKYKIDWAKFPYAASLVYGVILEGRKILAEQARQKTERPEISK